MPKIGEKIRKNRGKIRKKEEKSGRKRKIREVSFTLPLLTDKAGYATDCAVGRVEQCNASMKGPLLCLSTTPLSELKNVHSHIHVILFIYSVQHIISRQCRLCATDIETEIPKFQYRQRKFFSRHGEQFGGIRDFAEKRCGEYAMHNTRAITLMCVAEVAAFLARLKTRSYRRKMQLTHTLSVPPNCSPCREKMAANFGVSPLYLCSVHIVAILKFKRGLGGKAQLHFPYMASCKLKVQALAHTPAVRYHPSFAVKMAMVWKEHTPDTLGTLPDIAANARPLRAWLKCSLNVAQ